MPNIEIKAVYPDLAKARAIAQGLKARFVRQERQVDTYFATPQGRLKLRETSQNRAELIPYFRPDSKGPKKCDYAVIPVAEAAESFVVGSGGGFSTLEPEPSYQRGVPGTNSFHAVQYLTPTTYVTVAPGLVEPTAWNFNPTPGVTTGLGFGRAIPDLATNADPQTGYLVYGASAGGLNEAGGTSFVGPQLNGSTAVIDSYLGHRVGFWNPYLYAAAGGPNSPFTQLNQASTSNDNIYYTGNPGKPYNEGIGLGQPNLAELAGDFGG